MVAGRYGRLGAAALAAAALMVAARPDATAQVPVPPPPRPLPTVATTAPPPTLPPPTAAPTTVTTAPAPTNAPPPATTATMAPPTTSASPTTTPAGGPTTTAAGTVTTAGPATTAAPAKPGAAPPPTTARPPAGPPPASLSDGSVSSYLSGLARNTGPGASTNALLDALRPLQDYGLSRDQAIAVGFGRFPVGGEAYYRDDYGEAREAPTPHAHQGNDIFAPFGAPVRSPASGVVTFANEVVGGLCAYVTEPDGTWYYLAHLRGFAPGVVSGAAVQAGEVIGYNGDSGNAKGSLPHVHFEVHPKGGAAVSPKPYLDAWLAEALAAVPGLLAPYRGAPTSPLTAIGLARHLDLGILAGMPRHASPLPGPTARELAAALVDPLTPPALRPG